MSISSTRIGYPILMTGVLHSPKTNTLADGLDEITLSTLDEIASKAMHKDEASNR